MIKKDDYRDSREEYEGEVTCSSKYDGKWQINADSDDPTPIAAGYCIASSEILGLINAFLQRQSNLIIFCCIYH